jgi:photosystem II stability/assembly factor-like uncharacterized protein
MLRCLSFLLILAFFHFHLPAQQIELLTSGTKTSIRGLSVVNDHIVWVSGSNGTVGRSTDGGKNWQWITVKGFEKKDFRDIEAFSAQTAIIMSIAEPAYMLKTTDGGQNWRVVFADSTKGMFLDAMSFYDHKHGVVVGDPINGKFFIAKTRNGETWEQIPPVMQSNSLPGEGCFASSGTNIYYFRNKDFLFVSGGPQSRLHDDSGGRLIDMAKGKESTGANSIAVRNKRTRVSNHFIVVGGDFTNDKDTTGNCLITHDAGQTWIRPVTPPAGYRSCVIYISNKTLLTCGTSGIDLSKDRGMNWQPVSKEGFHVCQKAKKGKAVFLAGGNGKIAKLIY